MVVVVQFPHCLPSILPESLYPPLSPYSLLSLLSPNMSLSTLSRAICDSLLISLKEEGRIQPDLLTAAITHLTAAAMGVPSSNLPPASKKTKKKAKKSSKVRKVAPLRVYLNDNDAAIRKSLEDMEQQGTLTVPKSSGNGEIPIRKKLKTGEMSEKLNYMAVSSFGTQQWKSLSDAEQSPYIKKAAELTAAKEAAASGEPVSLPVASSNSDSDSDTSTVKKSKKTKTKKKSKKKKKKNLVPDPSPAENSDDDSFSDDESEDESDDGTQSV